MSNAESPTSPTSRPVRAGDHVFLIDGSGYIFRAYHALPPLTRKSDGVPVGAVSGFCNMLWRLLKETEQTAIGVRPTHLAVIFDASSITFRNEIYPLYKAQRPEPPADLRPQFGLIREAVRAFNVACVEQLGFEADDLIATYAEAAASVGADVTIVSSDKDLMQLVGERVVLLDTMKDRRIGVPEVIEKFGVTPDKVVEVQSSRGRLRRQRAWRTRHRPENGGSARPRIWRPRSPARRGGRHQATEAAGKPDRLRRAGPHFASPGDAETRCAVGASDRYARRSADSSASG